MVDGICLVIPYYEEGHRLLRTLDSVRLRTTDTIVVVDDGSRQEPAVSTCPPDVRGTPVTLVTLETNQGIANALRTGVAQASPDTAFIARLDCGDTARPTRFERQRRLLSQNANLVLVGTGALFVRGSDGSAYRTAYPARDGDIVRYLRINNAIVHASSMFRLSAYRRCGGYSERYPAAEDYALFRQMARIGWVANINEVLTVCDDSDAGISAMRRRRQILSRLKVNIDNFGWTARDVYAIARASTQLILPNRIALRVRRIINGWNGRSVEDGG